MQEDEGGGERLLANLELQKNSDLSIQASCGEPSTSEHQHSIPGERVLQQMVDDDIESEAVQSMHSIDLGEYSIKKGWMFLALILSYSSMRFPKHCSIFLSAQWHTHC